MPYSSASARQREIASKAWSWRRTMRSPDRGAPRVRQESGNSSQDDRRRPRRCCPQCLVRPQGPRSKLRPIADFGPYLRSVSQTQDFHGSVKQRFRFTQLSRREYSGPQVRTRLSELPKAGSPCSSARSQLHLDQQAPFPRVRFLRKQRRRTSVSGWIIVPASE